MSNHLDLSAIKGGFPLTGDIRKPEIGLVPNGRENSFEEDYANRES